MTPVLVSYVSSVICRLHGGPEFGVNVREMVARISVRVPVAPDLPNGRLTETMASLATVNGVAEPIAVPLALRNVTEPVQDAAVPFEAFDAVLTKLICAVSELARPRCGVSPGLRAPETDGSASSCCSTMGG